MAIVRAKSNQLTQRNRCINQIIRNVRNVVSIRTALDLRRNRAEEN